MAKSAMFIDYEGSPHPVLDWLTTVLPVRPLRRFRDRYVADSTDRRNPRTAAYMRKLVDERHGPDAAAQIRTISRVDQIVREDLQKADQVVLLWRDGNGAGWRAVERHLFRHRRAGTPLIVINGRRREFELTPAVRRGYSIRRFLEKSFLVEGFLFAAFWIVAPPLACWDFVRGRR